MQIACISPFKETKINYIMLRITSCIMKSMYHIGYVSDMLKHQVKFDNAFQCAIERP